MTVSSIVILAALLVSVIPCDADVKYAPNTNSTGFRGSVRVRGIVAPGTGRYPTWLGEVPLNQRWPGGVVPYTYSPLFSAAERTQFERAIADYNKYTCIKFIPRTDQYDFMYVQGESSGCWAYLGRFDNNGQGQLVNLERNTWCTQFKSVSIHELWHVLGLEHYEDYLAHVIAENMFPDQDADTFGLPDYNNPPREANDLGLSALEKFRIRRMYKCYGSTALLYA